MNTVDTVDINIATLNVRGLNRKDKRNIVYSWIKKNSYDICFLQETFYTLQNSAKFKRGWNGEQCHSYTNSTHSRDVAILLNKNLDYNVISSHCDTDGRISLVNLQIGNNEYTLVNVYAPNIVSERITFFHEMREFIHLHAVTRSRLIIGGDFNCVLNANDRVSSVTDRSTSVLLEVLEHFSLIDVWKCLNPTQVAFTYIDPTVRMHHSRIDHVLCSKALKSLCFLSNICQAPVSDHKVVNVHLKAKKNDRGKGYWKMNNSMLNIEEYDLGIRKIYDEVILEYGQDGPKSLIWDYFKIEVKEFSIAFGIQQAQCRKDKCKELESLLDSLDKQLAVHSDTSLHQKRK